MDNWILLSFLFKSTQKYTHLKITQTCTLIPSSLDSGKEIWRGVWLGETVCWWSHAARVGRAAEVRPGQAAGQSLDQGADRAGRVGRTGPGCLPDGHEMSDQRVNSSEYSNLLSIFKFSVIFTRGYDWIGILPYSQSYPHDLPRMTSLPSTGGGWHATWPVSRVKWLWHHSQTRQNGNVARPDSSNFPTFTSEKYLYETYRRKIIIIYCPLVTEKSTNPQVK